MLRRVLPPAVLLLGASLLLLAPPARDAADGSDAIARAEGARRDAPPRLLGRYRPVTDEAPRCRAGVGIGGARANTAGASEDSKAAEANAPGPEPGPGRVAGRVRFPDGTPAAFVAVRITALRSPPPPPFRSPPHAPAPGLPWSTTCTDVQGRFRAAGLRPGPLEVGAPCVRGGASVRVASGTEDVELVARAHRVRVRVLDPEDRPLAGADVGVRYVVEGRCPIDRCTVRPDDGSRNLWLDPGDHVIAAGHLEGYTVAEQELVVPERPWSRTVDLVLVPHGPETGWLRIHLTDETGHPLAPPDVVLTSPLAGSRTTRGDTLHADADGVVQGIPPDSYRVCVHPVDGAGIAARRYCFVQRPVVTVRPGAETRLDLGTTTGGRLLLREWCAAPEVRGDLEARVRFERPGVTEELSLWLDPDDEDESILLEPGVWTMVVYGEGVRESRQSVVVEAGTTRDVTVDLRVP